MHARPQPPQFGSWVGATQALPHLMRPAVQLKPHCPEEQVACPPEGAVHAVPQAPQFNGSEPVATHWPLQLVVPLGQLRVQRPLEQTLPAPQARPHAPQLALSVCLLTQALPHRERPALQLGAHCPPTHAVDPPAGAVQASPQPPQWLGSLEVLTQAPLHLL